MFKVPRLQSKRLMFVLFCDFHETQLRCFLLSLDFKGTRLFLSILRTCQLLICMACVVELLISFDIIRSFISQEREGGGI